MITTVLNFLGLQKISKPLPAVATQVIEQKANPVGKLIDSSSLYEDVIAPADYAALSKEAYVNCSVGRAVIGRIARRAAELPIKLQQKNKQGKWEDLKSTEDDEHPIMVLLNKPNPMQSKADFLESVFATRKMAGESFIAPVSIAPGATPIELWWLRPDYMKHTPAGDGTIRLWAYGTGKGQQVFNMLGIKGCPPIIHWKTFNPTDQFRGLSEIQSAGMQVCQVNEGSKWNAKALKNGMRPSGGFVYKPVNDMMSPTLSDPQRRQLQDDIEKNLVGAENAYRPLILDGGLDWREMSISPKDFEWLEGNRDASRTICFVLNYPPLLLGIPGDATFKNYSEARLSLYQETLIPLMQSLLDLFNETIVPCYGDNLRLVVDLDKIEALSELRATTWERIERTTFMTLNEKREIFGLPKLPSKLADQIWVSTSLTPIDEALDSQQDTPEEDPAEADDKYEDYVNDFKSKLGTALTKVMKGNTK